jgi:hypothetical protein
MSPGSVQSDVPWPAGYEADTHLTVAHHLRISSTRNHAYLQDTSIQANSDPSIPVNPVSDLAYSNQEPMNILLSARPLGAPSLGNDSGSLEGGVS